MEESSIPVTAFVIPIAVKGARHFEWTVLPFGLKNAPPIFQRVMGHVLQGLDKFALVYMDDVLIHSKDREEHLLHVEKVLERLKRFNLKCNPKKCEWFRTSTTFLGHLLVPRRSTTSSQALNGSGRVDATPKEPSSRCKHS